VAGEDGTTRRRPVSITPAPERLDRLDPLEFRRVMGHFPTGVTVLTTVDGGRRHGMTANAITSVSLDPVLILVCLAREARTGLAIQRARRFAVNFLREDQEEVSRRFARPGEDRFEGLAVQEDESGLPLLPGATAHLVCRVTEIVTAGDHDIVIAEVERARANGGNPLVFHLGGYKRLPGLGRLG
jgi:3-hydroxy-9,10-secoandrosta-1,3,5(10)-triene-9,17-dione monooxygenase reductase component